MIVFGNEGDAEPSVLIVIVSAAIAGKLDGRPHFFEDPQVIVQAAFGYADLLGAVGGSAGTFQMDKIVEADKPM